MSVIVQGVEILVSGDKYRVCEDLEGNKYLTPDGYFSGQYYPINKLPDKHGRLIDADALMSKSAWYNLCGHNRSIHGVQDYEIASIETIVEAEGD